MAAISEACPPGDGMVLDSDKILWEVKQGCPAPCDTNPAPRLIVPYCNGTAKQRPHLGLFHHCMPAEIGQGLASVL